MNWKPCRIRQRKFTGILKNTRLFMCARGRKFLRRTVRITMTLFSHRVSLTNIGGNLNGIWKAAIFEKMQSLMILMKWRLDLRSGLRHFFRRNRQIDSTCRLYVAVYDCMWLSVAVYQDKIKPSGATTTDGCFILSCLRLLPSRTRSNQKQN